MYKGKNHLRLNEVIYTLINSIFKITILLQPFLPDAAKKIFNLLKQKDEFYFSEIKCNIKSGILIKKPEPIFPRIEKDKI